MKMNNKKREVVVAVVGSGKKIYKYNNKQNTLGIKK